MGLEAGTPGAGACTVEVVGSMHLFGPVGLIRDKIVIPYNDGE